MVSIRLKTYGSPVNKNGQEKVMDFMKSSENVREIYGSWKLLLLT